MKNLLILFVLISNYVYPQKNIEISNKYYIVSDDNKFWKDSIFIQTKFEISSKTISYTNKNTKHIFKVMSSDKVLIDSDGDTIIKTHCKDFNNNKIEIVFLTSKNKDKYIYILGYYTEISFEIN